MPLAKQLVQFFFGATDQDTSRKGVRTGDLVSAVNVQQIHPGKLCKRGGFLRWVQTYDSPASVIPDSMTSPDGVQAIVRDATTDTVFAKMDTAGTNMAKGASRRITAKWPVRFLAHDEGENARPMAKQAGPYYVWLEDEQHFRIAQRTADSETLLTITDPILVDGNNAEAGSFHCKSFAVVDDASFDSAALWIFWVDWSDNAQERDSIWAYRCPHSDLTNITRYQIYSGTTMTNRCATSITAGVVGSGRLTIVAVGGRPYYETYTEHTFRYNGLPVHSFMTWLQISQTGGTVTTLASGEDVVTTANHNWTGNGVSLLSIKTEASYLSGQFACAYWGASATADATDLIACVVNEDTGVVARHVIDTFTETDVLGTHRYTDPSPTQKNFIGSTTGYETATGLVIIAQCRLYYLVAGEFVDPTGAAYPDRLFTRCYGYVHGTGIASVTWTARGAWLAHGWFEWTDGTKLVITGWQDADEIQLPYHLRRVDTGAILAQFAYGEAAYPGGCARTEQQVKYHVADIQHPMLSQYPLSTAASDQLVLAITSESIYGSVNVANVKLEVPAYQNPVAFRSLVLAPGPVPSISSGWQTLAEAGPLTYPAGAVALWGSGAT